MARLAFHLPLCLLLLGSIFCRSLMADSEEVFSPNPQVNGGGTSSASVPSDDDVVDPGEIEEANSYLRKFGYFDDDNEPVYGTQRSAANIERAIAFMQYKAHIPVTGKLNKETIAMMRQPRCGNKDFNGPSDRLRRRRRRYSLSGNKWNKRVITYRYVNFTPDLGRRTTYAEIDRAFNLWSSAANIDFKQVQSGNADIAIRFAYGDHGDGYDFDGQGGVLAHAFFPGRESISGDAHFDEHERFTANTQFGTNLYMVAAHELGHSLGLGHSDVQNSMMAPIYQGYTHGFRLHRDDIRGIQRLYGARQTGSRPRPPSQPPSRPRPPTGPGSPTTPTCNIRVDALLITSPNDLLAFRNNEYWHLRSTDGQTFSIAGAGFPKPISSRFKLPGRSQPLANIDAAYQRNDGSYRFFKGTEYFDFESSGNFLYRGQARQLFRRQQRRNMPTRIDAAVMVPVSNNPVYLFRGQQYWRLNDEDNRIDFGYPQQLSRWSSDLPQGMDAAFFAAGSVFFIYGNNYRQFIWDSNTLATPPNGQLPRIDRQFFGCGRLQDTNTFNSADNGQAPSRSVQSWALVLTMMAASTAACQLMLL